MPCKAELSIRADDESDETATLQCRLPEGHPGMHRQRWDGWMEDLVIEWDYDKEEESA